MVIPILVVKNLRCLECEIDIIDECDRFNEFVLNDLYNNKQQELGIGFICCTSILFSVYHYKDKYGEFYSPGYATAVKTTADAKNLDKIKDKYKIKFEICNTIRDKIDFFNLI